MGGNGGSVDAHAAKLGHAKDAIETSNAIGPEKHRTRRGEANRQGYPQKHGCENQDQNQRQDEIEAPLQE